MALAAVSEAQFLVTGDKSLLALRGHGVTRIVTPAAMIEFLNTPDSPSRKFYHPYLAAEKPQSL